MKICSPVSNLICLIKVIEEAAGRQFARLLQKHPCKNLSLIAIFDALLSGLDEPITAILIAMLDMSAAFDYFRPCYPPQTSKVDVLYAGDGDTVVPILLIQPVQFVY